MKKIERESRWLADNNLTYTVMWSDTKEVVAWSEPVEHPKVGGLTWAGKPSEFLKAFKPIIKGK
jgi:hypothetical protein